ncbi:hypothetical protein GPROT1_01695 [Gammaproteobacteria bacterium]|nr:hypothetical protein GPROT1_01695 [Gammaproteobacteria bacterium]
MIRRALAVLPLLAILTLAADANAQHDASGGSTLATAPAEARQFDFLIGQWSLDVRPKVSGLAARIHGAPKFTGTWKAWRAFDGWGIEDELRILDSSGGLRSVAHALRVFDVAAGRWSLTTLDVMRARFTPSSARFEGRAMVVTATAKDQDGKDHLVRVRFHEITATGFRYEQARSYDQGKTWEDPTLRITARRTAAAATR